MSIAKKWELLGDFPVLESERLRLRQIVEGDAEALFQCVSHPLVKGYVTLQPQTLLFPARLYRYFEETYRTLQDLHFAIELKESGQVIGICSLQFWDVHQRRARLGYLLSPDYWNRGYTTESVGMILELGFNRLELKRIEGRCNEDNPGSERVLQKNGMSYIKTEIRQVPCGEQRLKIYAICQEDFQRLDKL